MSAPGAPPRRAGLRTAWVALGLAAVAAAAAQRVYALQRLGPDFDEPIYLQAGYRYAEMMAPGRAGEILHWEVNREHPPLQKLVFAAALRAAEAPEPDWSAVRIGGRLPEPLRPAFEAGRWPSAVAGTLQVALLAVVHPVAAWLVALEPYHAKYSAQVMLEAIPGLLALLAVLVLERALGRCARPGAAEGPPRLGLAAGAFALLGAAAAAKYPYGGVGLVAFAPFVVRAFPRRPLAWLGLVVASAVAFLALDPYLWPDPAGRLWETVRHHLAYSRSEHVVRSNLPWYQQAVWLLRAAPLEWHPGIFVTGLPAIVLLPLAALGAAPAWRARPVLAAWAAAATLLLVLWPTKWPQYLLVATPAYAVLAALALEAAARRAARLVSRRGARAAA